MPLEELPGTCLLSSLFLGRIYIVVEEHTRHVLPFNVHLTTEKADCNSLHQLPAPADPEEHSLQAFCSDNKLDLMNEVVLSDSCGAGDPDDVGSSTAAYSSDSSYPTDEAVSTSSSGATQSSSPSTTSTVSPKVIGATPTSGTSTSPTPQATPATGAASRRWVTYLGLVSRLGPVVLPILAF